LIITQHLYQPPHKAIKSTYFQPCRIGQLRQGMIVTMQKIMGIYQKKLRLELSHTILIEKNEWIARKEYPP
jgi:hypothetical protein